MSDYTHKIILFTKNDYSGDALVVMATDKRKSEISNFADIKYKDLNGTEKNFDDVFLSLIVEKGSWEIYYDEIGSSSYNYKREDNADTCRKEKLNFGNNNRFTSMISRDQ